MADNPSLDVPELKPDDLPAPSLEDQLELLRLNFRRWINEYFAASANWKVATSVGGLKSQADDFFEQAKRYREAALKVKVMIEAVERKIATTKPAPELGLEPIEKA